MNAIGTWVAEKILRYLIQEISKWIAGYFEEQQRERNENEVEQRKLEDLEKAKTKEERIDAHRNHLRM